MFRQQAAKVLWPLILTTNMKTSKVVSWGLSGEAKQTCLTGRMVEPREDSCFSQVLYHSQETVLTQRRDSNPPFYCPKANKAIRSVG